MLADLRAQIVGCTACRLREGCRAPVPWRGPLEATVAVLGEAPGKAEDASGKPFVGPAGAFLQHYLEKVGFDPVELVYFNAVCCFPGRTPRPDEVFACRKNFWDQMVLVSPDFVLVVGGTALQALRPGCMISSARGQPWRRELRQGGERTYFPTWHPAAVLRNRALTKQWRHDLEQFKELVDGAQRGGGGGSP